MAFIRILLCLFSDGSKQIHDTVKFIHRIIFNFDPALLVILLIDGNLCSKNDFHLLFEFVITSDCLHLRIVLFLFLCFRLFLFLLYLLYQFFRLTHTQFFVENFLCCRILFFLIVNTKKCSRMSGRDHVINYHLLYSLVEF